MLRISSWHSAALAAALLLAPLRVEAGDTPREKAKQPDSRKAEQREAERKLAQELADREKGRNEVRAKIAEIEHQNAKLAADSAQAEARAKEAWDKLDPRLQSLLDPDGTAAQYELVETCFNQYPAEMLANVEKAILDGAIRLTEFVAVESTWELTAKPKAKERTTALIQQLRNFPTIAPEAADAKAKPGPFQLEGSFEEATSKPTSETEERLRVLRAEVIATALRGDKSSDVEGPKLLTLLGLKDEQLAKLKTELQQEARAAQHEEIERYLKLYPAELLKYVERAYEDGKVTRLEYEVVMAVKEQVLKRACLARIKASIHDFRWGKK